MSKTKHLPLILCALTLATGGWWLSTPRSVPPRIIEIRADGFTPTDLVITAGETVTFVNKNEKSMWPASDPHPTHENLSWFDPGAPLPPEKTWEHQFTKAGTWRYHDHLNVSLRGTITVTGTSGEEETSNCDYGETEESANERCFDARIRKAVEEGGVEAGFAMFTELYEKGMAPASCHWTAHLIGEKSYELFRREKETPLSPATRYCGYAFYHGFLEALLRDNPDVAWARSFCEYVKKELGDQAQDNCFHGIGHGFTEDPPDPRIIGNANAMLAPGLKVCEYLYGTITNKWEICATGVYTVVTGFMWEKKYGLSLDPQDPFAFCRAQPERYHWACYGEIAPKLDHATNWDVAKLANYLHHNEDEKTAAFIVRAATGAMMQRDVAKTDLSNYVDGCRTLPNMLPDTCIRAVAWGLVSHAEPNKEDARALRFCESAAMSREERSACYDETIISLNRIYPQNRVKKICADIPTLYRPPCDKILGFVGHN